MSAVRPQSAQRIVLITLTTAAILLAACLLAARQLDRVFSPPNAKMLTERLTPDGTLLQ
jgi:hypothetical protein